MQRIKAAATPSVQTQSKSVFKLRDSGGSARSHGCTQRSSTLSRIPSSSSVPSLTSLALSLSASAQPLTHNCCQPLSPVQCVSAPIDKAQHVCTSPIFHVRSSDRIAAPGRSPSPPPEHAPQTFPPYMSTPLSHDMWPRRSSSSTPDSPRSLSRDSLASSVSKPTADSPTVTQQSPHSVDASPATHHLSAASEITSKRARSLMPPPARYRPASTATACSPGYVERSTFRRATDSVLLSARATVCKPPVSAPKQSIRGCCAVSEELQPLSISNNRSSLPQPSASTAPLRPNGRSSHTRIALGVTNRAPGAHMQAPERLSFDFRDDEPSTTLNRGRQVAASRMFRSTANTANGVNARSFQSVLHGHRSWQAMQGSDTDADASEVPLLRACAAEPSPPPPPHAIPNTQKTLQSPNSALEPVQRPASRPQDRIWEHGNVWQFDEPRTAASYYGGSKVSSGLRSGLGVTRASVQAVGVQSRTQATLPCSTTAVQHPSASNGAMWTSAAAIPRSMRMKQNSVVLPEEEDACSPWQLGTEQGGPSFPFPIQDTDSQMAACADMCPTSQPSGTLPFAICTLIVDYLCGKVDLCWLYVHSPSASCVQHSFHYVSASVYTDCHNLIVFLRASLIAAYFRFPCAIGLKHHAAFVGMSVDVSSSN